MKSTFTWLQNFLPREHRVGETLAIGEKNIPLRLVRNPRARRYILRLGSDGSARVTVPRGGTLAEAGAFARAQVGWLATQLQKRAAQAPEPATWRIGQKILFRGESVLLSAAAEPGEVCFADQTLRSTVAPDGDLRPFIERHLRRLAEAELPARTRELAARHGLTVMKVTVRNQRSRWGSCSIRGTISLNWRLIQTPDSVRDYIIIHELMHLREMNHSPKFWRCVAEAQPNFRVAERWLKNHARCLR